MKKSKEREATEHKDEKVTGPLDRRGFIKGFGAGGAIVVAAGLVGCKNGSGGTDNNNNNTNNNNTNNNNNNAHTHPAVYTDVLVGTIEDGTGRDYSPVTGAERVAIPSACWQCVTRDAIIGYVEDGRLEHIEGNHRLLRTNGKLCSRGQGGVGQVYDPDRMLFPMRRASGTARGAGSWERISWADAMSDLVSNLTPLITNNEPEKLYFHYGRMKASSSKIIKSYFLKAFGTKTISGHTAICESNKWTAQELVWGHHYDVWDVEHSNVILNFGCNVLEAHTNHVPLSQRVAKAIEAGTHLYTFDVRLSNTAARSTSWQPVNPATDQAVLLAMANHIITNNLMPPEGVAFINEWTDLDTEGGTFATKVDKLEYFLTNPRSYLQDARAAATGTMPAYFDDADQPAGGYTPAWAEGISGVPAATIVSIAEEYANNSPGSVIMTYRGAVMHFNGLNTERTAQMLEGMCGNIDVQGGRVHGVGAGWDYHTTYPKPSAPADEAGISLENKSAYVVASHGASHQTLETIKAETIANGNVSPISCYMVYCYAPAYANGNMQENIDILKSETYIPYLVVSDVAYSEVATYADLLLPDSNYLERWDWEDMVSMHHIPEWYIRQPVVQPLGEAEDFKNTVINLAGMLVGDRPEMQAVADIGSAESFVEAACNDTPEVNDAGVASGYANGFEFMKAEGAYYDSNATPAYQGYMSTVDLSAETIYDAGNPPPNDAAEHHCKDPDGTVYTATLAQFTAGYRATGYKHYVAQELASNPGTYYKGFKPDKINKSGLFELESVIVGAKDYPPMPVWMPTPEHRSLASDELILTTFKSTTQTHSRTQNCKYNTEITHHSPAWINAATANALGITDGDTVTLTRTGELFNDLNQTPALTKGTSQTSMQVEVRVTEAVHPKVIAISHSEGHWAYGRYASGNNHPMASETEQADQIAADPDASLIWWNDHGFRGNWIMPNAGDPIGGGMRWFDTVVTVS